MGFLTEFNRCFKQGLEPYGFIKMRGCNIFGKLVNDEIIHYITFQRTSPMDKGNHAFFMKMGVQTIYCVELSKWNLDITSSDLLRHTEIDETIPRVWGFGRYEFNEENNMEVLKKAFQDTLLIYQKYLSKVTDLECFIQYRKELKIRQLQHADKMQHDSLILIKTHNHETFEDIYSKRITQSLKRYGNEMYPAFLEDKKCMKELIFRDIVEPRDRVYQSPELMKQVEEELERRKEKNIELLKQYGLMGKK